MKTTLKRFALSVALLFVALLAVGSTARAQAQSDLQPWTYSPPPSQQTYYPSAPVYQSTQEYQSTVPYVYTPPRGRRTYSPSLQQFNLSQAVTLGSFLSDLARYGETRAAGGLVTYTILDRVYSQRRGYYGSPLLPPYLRARRAR